MKVHADGPAAQPASIWRQVQKAIGGRQLEGKALRSESCSGLEIDIERLDAIILQAVQLLFVSIRVLWPRGIAAGDF